MARHWLRTIDAAQRRITVERPNSPSFSGLRRVTFEIQGALVEYEGGHEHFFYYGAMAELGIKLKGAKPLTIFERLLRREAPIGDLVHLDRTRIRLSYWTQPVLDLIFDLEHDEEAVLWRECEIMALSAGFHFRSSETRSKPEPEGGP